MENEYIILYSIRALDEGFEKIYELKKLLKNQKNIIHLLTKTKTIYTKNLKELHDFLGLNPDSLINNKIVSATLNSDEDAYLWFEIAINS